LRLAELPVQKVELFLNAKTARQLGISVPQTVLMRADQVIQ
jgi:ABC-type uncharacterized transport system substrate-binding protein